MNLPVMISINQIVSLEQVDEQTIMITMSNERAVITKMPREILVSMITKLSNETETVRTHSEWAG